MNICVVGAGAIGSVIGGRLSTLPSVNVTFIARSNYQHISRNGIQLKTDSWGDFHVQPQLSFSTPEQAAHLSFDYVIITTKALPEQKLEELVFPLISHKTTIILIQNGIGIEDPYCAKYPSNPIVSVIAYIAASQVEPGVVTQTGFHYFNLGLFTNRGMDALDQFLTVGREARIDLRGPFEDIQVYRWHKLIWNCAFNPLSILCGDRDCKVLLNDPSCKELIRRIMDEVFEAAKQVLKKPFPSELSDVDGLIEVTRKIGAYKPSMLLD
jgi:2-dehydropantoate 2-reductase